MKSYRLNIEVVIATVGIFSLVVFCLVLYMFNMSGIAEVSHLLLDYGYLIAPASLLWVATNKYLWHTKLFQGIRKTANIPPDLRGRWEGVLQNMDGDTQKFAIEVKQTLTTLHVVSYSTLGRSVSILPEIASSDSQEMFSLCYLWQGETHTSMRDFHHRVRFNGYTILHLHEHENPKILKGSYFTNHVPNQTRGGIELKWVSKELKRKLE